MDVELCFPTSVYSESEDSMSVYVLKGVAVFAGRWWLTHGSVHTPSSKQGRNSCSVVPPYFSYLFLGFVLKYPEPHLSFPALQVFVCPFNWFARRPSPYQSPTELPGYRPPEGISRPQ